MPVMSLCACRLATGPVELQVILTPAETMSIVPHPQHDTLEAPSVQSLVERIRLHGCGGGTRLLQVGQSTRPNANKARSSHSAAAPLLPAPPKASPSLPGLIQHGC